MRRLVEHWDWLVYRLACGSLRRMCEHNGGFAYLMQLWLMEWRKQHPISPELERSTEMFFESLNSLDSSSSKSGETK